MALPFVLQIQKDNQDEMPFLSVPAIKRIFAKKLLNQLNSHDGLFQPLHVRHQQTQDDIDRLSKVPK